MVVTLDPQPVLLSDWYKSEGFCRQLLANLRHIRDFVWSKVTAFTRAGRSTAHTSAFTACRPRTECWWDIQSSFPPCPTQAKWGTEFGGLNCLYCWASPWLKLEKVENIIQKGVIMFKAEGCLQLPSAGVWIQHNLALWADACCPYWWHWARRNYLYVGGCGWELNVVSANWLLYFLVLFSISNREKATTAEYQ